MDLQLVGRRSIVTGGSSGIGFAVARRLLAEGADCIITGRDQDRLQRAVASLSGSRGAVHALVHDASEVDRADRVVGAARELFGGVDILVNNAARASGEFVEGASTIDLDVVRSDFEEKVLGYLAMARCSAADMQLRGAGSIVNVAGISARLAGQVSSGIRNSAIVNMTKALSIELRASGIAVNAVHPGLTRTAAVQERLVESDGQDGDTVSVEQVADVVAFLCSPRSNGISGEVLAVTAGSGNAVHY
jgi:NAD(P)-dependent dehydrogenase (short-subunit alcohol dehydrogenase family)